MANVAPVIHSLKMNLSHGLVGAGKRLVQRVAGSRKERSELLGAELERLVVEAGKLGLESISFDVRLVIEDVAELHAPNAEARGLELIHRTALDLRDAIHIGQKLRVLFERHGDVRLPLFEPDPCP